LNLDIFVKNIKKYQLLNYMTYGQKTLDLLYLIYYGFFQGDVVYKKNRIEIV